MTAASVPSVTVSKNTREVPQLATMSYLRPKTLLISPGHRKQMLVEHDDELGGDDADPQAYRTTGYVVGPGRGPDTCGATRWPPGR